MVYDEVRVYLFIVAVYIFVVGFHPGCVRRPLVFNKDNFKNNRHANGPFFTAVRFIGWCAPY